MAEGDSVTIFCLKLERLARRAYPESRSEQEWNLCNKAKSTFPPSLVDKINNAQGLAEAFGGKKITWHMIKKLAENHDKVSRSIGVSQLSRKLDLEEAKRRDGAENPLYSVSHEEPYQHVAARFPTIQGVRRSESNNTHNTEWETGARRKTQFYRNSATSPPKYPGGRLNIQARCGWCNKTGHDQSTCWMKNGACLLCGDKSHYLRDCTKIRVNQHPNKGRMRMETSPEISADGQQGNHVQSSTLQPLNENALGQTGHPQSIPQMSRYQERSWSTVT